MDTINVLVSGNDLTTEEFNVVLTALRTYYEMLNDTPQGDRDRRRPGENPQTIGGKLIMTNQSAREEALKRKYPVGTKGKLSPTKAQPLTHLLSAGWEPHFVLTVERAYVSTSSIDCLVLRWGQGRYDWAKVMTEGFEAIAHKEIHPSR